MYKYMLDMYVYIYIRYIYMHILDMYIYTYIY